MFFIFLISAICSFNGDNINYVPNEKSDHAYITYISSQEYKDSTIINVLTLGYSLIKYSRNYDRIVIIPEQLQLRKDEIINLQKVYTSVIRIPYTTPSCSIAGSYLYDGRLFFFFKWLEFRTI